MRFKIILLLAAFSVFGKTLHSQENTGSIAGVVKDASTGKPLNEAVITVSSPELKGSKIALTDSTGNYKIVNLPAGIYTVIFEMEGFRKFTRDSIRLTKGMPLGVSLEMARERPRK